MENKTPGDLPNILLEGRYANCFDLGHNAFEVVLDFGQFFEGDRAPRMHTRIITSPVYAKSLSNLLQLCLQKYEQTFGQIPPAELHG